MEPAVSQKSRDDMMQQTDPEAFPYYCYWDVAGRKGQRCRILKAGTRTAHVIFEDGFERIVNRIAIRRIPCNIE
jgi:hypothetical protein